ALAAEPFRDLFHPERFPRPWWSEYRDRNGIVLLVFFDPTLVERQKVVDAAEALYFVPLDQRELGTDLCHRHVELEPLQIPDNGHRGLLPLARPLRCRRSVTFLECDVVRRL